MVHFRVGKPDGVSLEMDKWRVILEKQFGHKVTYLAGELGTTTGCLVPELALNYESSLKIRRNAFKQLSDFKTEKELEIAISDQINEINPKVKQYLNDNEINLLIVNNMFSLPMNIPATISLYEQIVENKIPTIIHHHDFWFEQKRYNPTVDLINHYLEKYYPPDLPGLIHVVINSLARKAMLKRKNIKSTIVPNVFYFEEYTWEKDEFNKDFLKRINIDEGDIVFLQATRIVPRKGIELVVDLLGELNKPEYLELLRNKPLYDGRRFGLNNKIVFVLPNLIEDQPYHQKIREKLEKNDIEYRFCNDIIAHDRRLDPVKKYSLWDTYVYADIVTYPSLWEGWGNQFLEAIKAKLPIIIFEYPVYISDILDIKKKRMTETMKYMERWKSMEDYVKQFSGVGTKNYLENYIQKNQVATNQKLVYMDDNNLQAYVSNIGPAGFKIIPLGSIISGYNEEGLVFVKKEILRRAAEETVRCLTNVSYRNKMIKNNYQIGVSRYSMNALARYLKPLIPL
jgi:glycosyltransferase involved in cell wall biosynthesis